MSPRCAHAVAAGVQHVAAVRALLRRIDAPVYATRGVAGRALAGEATVVDVGDGDLHAALADGAFDVVFVSGPCLEPARLRAHQPRTFVVSLGGSERTRSPAGSDDVLSAEADLVLTATKPFHARLVARDKALVGSFRHDLVVAGGLDRLAPLRCVLWAPGEGPTGSLAAWGPTVVAVTAALGIECWIHPHPASHRSEPHLVRWAHAQVLRHEHVTVLHTDQLERPMSKAAALLTDASSVVLDWLPFDRPTIVLDHPGLDPVARAELATSVMARDAVELEAALHGALVDPERDRVLRASARSRLFEALDGHATDRALDATWAAWERR